MSFFRYPGGKSKIKDILIEKINQAYENNYNLEYREPFIGGGSVCINFLSQKNKQTDKIWINDKDVGIACLWTSVINNPNKLIYKILNFKPSIDYFYEFKNNLLSLSNFPDTEDEIIDIGFKKIAIHQISYSGLGTKSGGPLGGKTQESNYKIDCRWSPNYIAKKINKLHKLFSEFKIRENMCTNYDFAQVIIDDSPSIIYLDPPYYVKGEELYQCGFNYNDHKRLSNCLKNKFKWVLSYDDCCDIINLYDWANIEKININYSINTARQKGELIICSIN